MPKSKYPQLKFFISTVNTLAGQAIVEELRNDHLNDINPHIIMGTKSSKNVGPVPSSVKVLINNHDPSALTKALVDADVVIYDLNSAKLDEVEYAIKVLKNTNYENEKFLILISSVMSWSNTPPKEKKEGEEEDAEPATLSDVEEDATQNLIPYRESDYARRKPSPRYEIFKSLETQCLNAGNAKKNLLSYVLCSGVLYGHGEEVFESYFKSKDIKQAWLREPEVLSYIGDGKNLIPTIHVKDLAMFVHFVISKRPVTRYIFAIDHAKRPTLKSHVEAISTGLGTGLVKPITILEAMNDPYLEIFKLNIKLQPSKVVEAVEGEDEQEDEFEEDLEDDDGKTIPPPKFKFTWWCKEGLKKNIIKVVEEYNTYRGLKPVKIFITGPPAGGKTHFGSRLSRVYNIPHIHTADIVKEAQEMDNEFGHMIRTVLAETKQKMIEEAEAALEELKKKKKKGQPDPVVDHDKIIPRLTDELLIQVYLNRLNRSDCVNRGFLLDGFPKTYAHAKALFLSKTILVYIHYHYEATVPPKEGEEANQEHATALHPKNVPEFIIKVEAPDEFLKARVKGLPEDQVAGTHYNEEGMNRRLATYHKHNVPEPGNPALVSFFEEHNLEVLKLKSDNQHEEELLVAMQAYIERNGKFKTYNDALALEEAKKKKKLREEQEEERKRQEAIRKQQEEKEREEKRIQEETYRLKLESVKQQEKQLLDQRSQSLRQYLADMVVPILTSGLIEICKENPEDPLDYLADYLLKRSVDVNKPDSVSPPLK